MDRWSFCSGSVTGHSGTRNLHWPRSTLDHYRGVSFFLSPFSFREASPRPMGHLLETYRPLSPFSLPYGIACYRDPKGGMFRKALSSLVASQRGKPEVGGLGGEPRDEARADFLGGMHPVRPRDTAPRMPKHSIPTGRGEDEPVAKRTHARVKPKPSPGRAEPAPPRGGPPNIDGFTETNLGTARRVVSSEGRGLRARDARPFGSRGIT
jgi:hypothetical protein